MARSAVQAVETASEEAPFGYKADGTPRKRKGKEGPRQRKPIHVVFKVTDSEGNNVEGASLEVIYAGTDTDALLDAVDSNPGSQRTKVKL